MKLLINISSICFILLFTTNCNVTKEASNDVIVENKIPEAVAPIVSETPTIENKSTVPEGTQIILQSQEMQLSKARSNQIINTQNNLNKSK